MAESARNKKISYHLPDEIQILKNEFGSSELFLRTCSRCEHCKNFLNEKCIVNKQWEDYKWLPLNQNNPCDRFDFDEKKWKF